MIISELKIYNLRILKSLSIHLHQKINFIIGPNGSGKTSILEALYILSCGHSFKSRETSPIISHDSATLNVFGRSQDEQIISVQKSRSEQTLIKLNGQFCKSTSELAYALPCQVIFSDLFSIIDAGPSVRRSLLDWGLFHVKHNYLSLLKDYKQVLRQRNALLRARAKIKEFIPWNKQLCKIALEIDKEREQYFADWQHHFSSVLAELTSVPCSISYYKGWDKKNTGNSLESILDEQFESDINKLYTQSGVHNADIIIKTDDTKVKNILSRGQQKIILIAMKLSQVQLLKRDCLYLLDDITAELDEDHQLKLFCLINKLSGQFVISSIQPPAILKSSLDIHYCIYRIEGGAIVE